MGTVQVTDHERGDPPLFEAVDGTLYWTLSFYIPYARLCPLDLLARASAIQRLPCAFNAPERLRDIDAHQNQATRKVREAVDPLFNDIADRTRQGDVRDRLLIDGVRETIIFHLPEYISWKTEGRRFRVMIPESDQQRPAEMRRFWYLHSDGAMSWHVAFAARYRDQLTTELEAGRVSSLYFLSLLQKLAWPKECDNTGIDDVSTDTLLNVRIGRVGGSIHERQLFWKQLEKWFEADRALLTDVHEAAANAAFADLFRPETCIEVPGLKMCETRSLFFIQDKQFFDLIQPKTPKGVLVPRRERILDDVFENYPELVRKIAPNAEQVHVLDEQFWRELLRDRTPVESDVVEETVHGEINEETYPLPGATERLLYLFLAGFNQNIIDWANQEASEVLDSLDPIYPSSDEQLAEGFFIRYANPRSLITYVPRSRTLEVGNDHILTCPYSFLIHVLSMNNEYLTRGKEKRAFEVIDWVSGQLSNEEALTVKGATAKKVLANVERQINRLRIDSFEHFDRHRYFNPFRYDTERDVFEELEQLRGTSRLEFAYKEALAALEEQARDLERLRAEAELKDERLADGKEQDRERKLAALFGLIGLSGVGQLMFEIYGYLHTMPSSLGTRDYALITAQTVIMVLIASGVWHFLLWPRLRRMIERTRGQ